MASTDLSNAVIQLISPVPMGSEPCPPPTLGPEFAQHFQSPHVSSRHSVHASTNELAGQRALRLCRFEPLRRWMPFLSPLPRNAAAPVDRAIAFARQHRTGQSLRQAGIGLHRQRIILRRRSRDGLGLPVHRWMIARRDRLSRYSHSVARRTETQSIESDADAQTILALLADPSRIPDWAPAFADAVTGDDQSGWHATKGAQEFTLRVVTNQVAGTVDYLREVGPGREGGAFIRAVPRPGGGGVVVMTVPLVPSADPAVIAATLRDELNALVGLAESN